LEEAANNDILVYQEFRKASENLAKDNQLIRVNPFDFEVNELNHISIPMNAGDFLKLI
jgi:hypothetical protein